MKITVGHPARKGAFFPRDLIINKIYRRLDSGANIFLSAPRRVGKTSIMEYLADNPREGYHFIYVITESVDHIEDYYKKLLEELLSSDVIEKLSTQSEKTQKAIIGVFDRIKTIGIPGIKLELNEREEATYQKEFERLLPKLETQGSQIVIMVDEYPQTIKNIFDKDGQSAANHFLKLHREQRHQTSGNVQFIYTGSIGLPIVVEKVGSEEVINDLNVVEVPPLSIDDAKKMAILLLEHQKVPYDPAAIDFLLQKIQWLIPFHIQLAIQEMVDVYETRDGEIDIKAVEQAFEQMCHRRNDIYFKSYYKRLRAAFEGAEYDFVIDLLNKLSVLNTLSKKEVREISINQQLENPRQQLSSLIFDGYIFWEESSESYRFTSPVLQLWWKKYIAS